MAEFLSAGVYIEEKKSSEQTVAGVSTSTFASVGWLEKGPVNKAIYIGGPTEFKQKFGSPWAHSDLPLAMSAFFSNGGQRAYIVRVVPSDATAATVTIPSGLWKLDAFSQGTWGNRIKTRIAGNKNYYNTATATFSKFDVTVYEESADGANDFAQQEIFEALDLASPNGADGFLTVMNDEDTGSSYVKVTEMAGGIPSVFSPTPVTAEAWGTGASGATQTVTHVAVQTPIAAFTTKIKVDGVIVAEDDGRGKIRQVGTSYTSITGTINYTTGSSSIVFTPGVTGTAITGDYIKAGVQYVDYDLAGGTEGTEVTRTEVTDASSLQADKKGLWALDAITDMCMIGLPDFMGNEVAQNELVTYCENRKDFFAILDCPKNMDAQDAYNYKRVTLANLSSYYGIYWPNVKVADPLLGGRSRVMSPVGHVAGLIAKTDTNRNVAKAPAGTETALQFCTGLERIPTKSDMDLIYPANINPFKEDPLTGRVIWGSRTGQVVGDYPQIGWRRLAQFLEKSFYNASQDLVFEPITDEVFARVTLRFTGFLDSLTGQDYFASKIPAEAFRFTCDRTNNSASSIAQRQLIGDCLFACQLPAEFIRLRFERSLNLLG